MDRKSTERLMLDRRLTRRRDWISKKELERALAELPDVSHKVAPPDEESGSEGAPSDDASAE